MADGEGRRSRQGRGHYRQAAARTDRNGHCNSMRKSPVSPISMPRIGRASRPPRYHAGFTGAAAAVITRHGIRRTTARNGRTAADPGDRRHAHHRSRRHRGELAPAVQQLRTVECAAVVKANAYGLGLEPVTAKLAKAGCKTFFVADLAEARRARPARARRRSTCSTDLRPMRRDAFAELNARPVINSTTELAEWDAFVAAQQLARRRGTACRHRHEPARHFGRRSGRAGLRACRPENHGITLLMSHLACAETPGHPLNAAQIRLFRELRILYSRRPGLARQFVRHLSRRYGAFRYREAGRRTLRHQSDARANQSDA